MGDKLKFDHDVDGANDRIKQEEKEFMKASFAKETEESKTELTEYKGVIMREWLDANYVFLKDKVSVMEDQVKNDPVAQDALTQYLQTNPTKQNWLNGGHNSYPIAVFQALLYAKADQATKKVLSGGDIYGKCKCGVDGNYGIQTLLASAKVINDPNFHGVMDDVSFAKLSGISPTEVTPTVEPKTEVTPAVEPKTEVTPAVEPKTEVTPTVKPKKEVTPTVEPKKEVVKPTQETTTQSPEQITLPEADKKRIEYVKNKMIQLIDETMKKDIDNDFKKILLDEKKGIDNGNTSIQSITDFVKNGTGWNQETINKLQNSKNKPVYEEFLKQSKQIAIEGLNLPVTPVVEPKKEVTAEKISESSDPVKQIALERAKHTMQLLKDQAISSLKSMNPEFKDDDDVKYFTDLKTKWEKRITDAQDTEGVFKAIESIQKELTKINTEKKLPYVNNKGKNKKERIKKDLTLDTSLDMQEYKSASEKALLYKMNAPVTIDAKTQELREKVKTSGEELSTATIAYKSASETLAGLFEQQATLEGTIVTLESQYTDVTNKITASSKNTVVSTTELGKLKTQQTELFTKKEQAKKELETLNTTIPIQQGEVNRLGGELTNKTNLYTTDIQTLKSHEQDQQKIVADRVEVKVKAYTDIAQRSVTATGQEWSSIQGTITTAQNDYQSIRFSIPDEQKTQDDITKMQELEKTISDETTNINKKIDTWIKNFTQQGITIQSVYAMHEYDARTNKEQVQANKQVVQNAHDELGIQVSTLETTIKTINAQLVDKNTSVDQIPILSSKNSQLITLQDALLVQQRSLEQKINELQVEEDKFNARETAANNAYAFTDVVLQQRILQFDEERTQQSVKHEINTQVNLGKQKESNNKEIATLSETKIGLLSDLTAKEIIFANAKKALGDAPKDQSLLQAFKKSAEEFTLVKKKVNENQQALDKYAALNTAIDTAVVESKTRQAAAEKQRDGYIKQRKDLDAQANDLNTKGTHKDLPNQQPATYLATNLPPAFPFEQK